MRLKVINSESVKVLIEKKDMDEGYPQMDMISPDIDSSGTFIVTLMQEILEKTGVNFLDSKVIIDILPGIDESYYLIISKMSTGRRILETGDEDVYIFQSDLVENALDALGVVCNSEIKADTVRIYKYKEKYYLQLGFAPESADSINFPKLLKRICKYAKKCKWSFYNEPVLSEWGELLYDNNRRE